MLRRLTLVVLLGFSMAGQSWAGATFSRVKTWSEGETLTASDLNGEFNNILNNLDPDGIDDESTNATAMQATRDPYPAAAESLATDLQDELQSLRYLIKQLSGEAQWYIDPDWAPTGGGTVSGGATTFTSSVTVSANALVSGTLTVNGNIVSTGAHTQSGQSLNTFTGPIAVSTAMGSGTPAANTMYSESFLKAFGRITVDGGTPSIGYGFNISSVADTGAGQVTVSFDRDFAGATNYVCVAVTETIAFVDYINQGAQSITIETRRASTEALLDNADFMIQCVGLQ